MQRKILAKAASLFWAKSPFAQFVSRNSPMRQRFNPVTNELAGAAKSPIDLFDRQFEKS